MLEEQRILETQQCIVCGTYTTVVDDQGRCEKCHSYTMDEKLEEESSNKDI